jgi:hypothetical protein
MMPSLCASSSASAISIARLRSTSTSSGPTRDPVIRRHAIHKLHGDEARPSCSPMSQIVQISEWFSAEAACASRWKRARDSSFGAQKGRFRHGRLA